MKISNLKIGVRLGVGFALMLVALAGLGWMAVAGLSASYAVLDKTVNQDLLSLYYYRAIYIDPTGHEEVVEQTAYGIWAYWL